MLAILGDIHGDLNQLTAALRFARREGARALIQIGDFGFDPWIITRLQSMHFGIPTYVIDGNHEDF